MFCSKCGTPIDNGNQFCGVCGGAVSNQVTTKKTVMSEQHISALKVRNGLIAIVAVVFVIAIGITLLTSRDTNTDILPDNVPDNIPDVHPIVGMWEPIMQDEMVTVEFRADGTLITTSEIEFNVIDEYGVWTGEREIEIMEDFATYEIIDENRIIISYEYTHEDEEIPILYFRISNNNLTLWHDEYVLIRFTRRSELAG